MLLHVFHRHATVSLIGGVLAVEPADEVPLSVGVTVVELATEFPLGCEANAIELKGIQFLDELPMSLLPLLL